MQIRSPSRFLEVYAGSQHPIKQDSPELLFIRAVCARDADRAAGLFGESKLFGGQPAVDAPNGRFEGQEGIRAFADGFLSAFHASSAKVTPAIQTRANGRSVTECLVDFVVDGMIEQVPMFVLGELSTADRLDEVRIYFHCTHGPGFNPYRYPIFKSSHLEMGEPRLLTGAVREYYVALHHVPYVDVDRIMDSMAEGCLFGGYEPLGKEMQSGESRAQLREKYEHMATYIPRWVGMRYETITDDGVNCVIEWEHIVSRAGQEEGGRIAILGISSYERGKDGRLCSIRICDYAGYENRIDWSKTPVSKEEAMKINFVEEFPDTGRGY